jgi:inner membrane transporter RhtA
VDDGATAARERGPLARAPSAGLVLGAITSVQFGAALAATIFADVGPGGAATLRLVWAAVILLAAWRPRMRGRSGRELRLAVVFGLVLAGMNVCIYESFARIPLGIAVAIEFVGPLGVAVLGSRRRLDLLWVAMAAVGIAALTRGGGDLDPVGVLFAFAAGVLWGVYIHVNARVGRTFEGATGLALAMCVAAAAVLPVGLAQAGSQLLEPDVLFVGAAVGILSSAIPYTLELEALRRIAPPVFGVLMSLEPAVAALAGLLVLGQSLGARALAGMALVVAASIGASRYSLAPPPADG